MEADHDGETRRVPLPILLEGLAHRWATQPDSDADDTRHGCTDDDEPITKRKRSSVVTVADLGTALVTADAPAGRSALADLLCEIGLPHLADVLQAETLRSCFIRLEARPALLVSTD